MEYAEDLAEAIVESQEFQELKEKEETMVEDEDAKTMLDELNAKYQQAQMMQKNGQQMSDEQKNSLSHRGKAFQKLREFLLSMQEQIK